MSVQTIDGDAKAERGGKAILSAASEVQGGIVNVACTQPAVQVWRRSGNPSPAGHYVSRRAQHLPIPEGKRRTEQVAEHVRATSTVEDVRSKRVTKIQFSSNTSALIRGNANVRSGQGDST